MAESERLLRPYAEWHEDHGSVLWWTFPVEEPPYVGSPLDVGFAVSSILQNQHREEVGRVYANVGGWPFEDHEESLLWWEPITVPDDPRPVNEDEES